MSRIIAGLVRKTDRNPPGDRAADYRSVREALFSAIAAWAGTQRRPSNGPSAAAFCDLYAGSGPSVGGGQPWRQPSSAGERDLALPSSAAQREALGLAVEILTSSSNTCSEGPQIALSIVFAARRTSWTRPPSAPIELLGSTPG